MECKLPFYELPLRNNNEKLLSLVSLGFYSVIRTHRVIEKYNKDMDFFYKCLQDSRNAPSAKHTTLK
jgi:hypothetical protein